MVRGVFQPSFHLFIYIVIIDLGLWPLFLLSKVVYMCMGSGMNVMSIRAYLIVCKQSWEQSLDWNIKPLKIKLI